MMDRPSDMPLYVCEILSEVQSEADPERALLRHVDRLQTDNTLALCYKSFGFSQSSRSFKRPLDRSSILRTLSGEYTTQPYLTEFVSEGINWLDELDLRSDLLKTFYDHRIDLISSPNQLGLIGSECFDSGDLSLGDNSLSTMWSVPNLPVEPRSPVSSDRSATANGFSFEQAQSHKHNGLRTISMRVRDIVSLKKSTTYKEVADVLIAELHPGMVPNSKEQFKEEKNVRRRVYDALNVLVASGIVAKTGKHVTWKNSQLPTKARTQTAKVACLNTIAEKRSHLRQLLVKSAHLTALYTRNQRNRQTHAILLMPFIILVPSDPDLSSVRYSQLYIKTSATNTKAELRMQQSFQLFNDLDVAARISLPIDMSCLPAEARQLCSV